MAIIGDLKEKSKGFEWKIYNFSLLSEEVNKSYKSPTLSFANHTCFLSIYPNGYTGNNSVGYIGIYLHEVFSNTSIKPEYSISFKILDDKKFKKIHCKMGHGAARSISRADLLIRKSELLPEDVLTVLCTLKFPKCTEGRSNTVTVQCSYCDEYLVFESISLHEKKCLEKPIKCPECSDVIVLRNWYAHECQTAQRKDELSFLQVYKKVLIDGKNHDLIFKIGDKELRAHQDILRARSHVFESMLSHDMTEKNSGVIDVPDCDPQAMELFLLHVYCGKVETLDESNMFGLYYIADKYDMKDLKEECCTFIRMSLSTTNICEVIQFAIKHSDSSLLENATEYFMDNALDIMVTMEWQNFLENNSTLGNELIIKSFRKVKNIKS